jgi:hypothetical protein
MTEPGQNLRARLTDVSGSRATVPAGSITARNLARIAARGPATVTEARDILHSPSARRRVGEAWADQCPDPDLLARVISSAQDTPPGELVVLTRQVLFDLHLEGCGRCSALLAALEQNDLLAREFWRRKGRFADVGRDWWPTVRISADRPESASQDGDVRARLLTGRIMIQARAFLAGGEVYATSEGTGPFTHRAVLRREGNHALATVHIPDDDATVYVDVALDREPALGRIADVDLLSRAVAAPAQPMTSERRSYDNVRVTSADGRSVALRVVTGVDGANVRLRIAGPDPVGGVWTLDGQRLAHGADVVVASAPVPVEEILLGLEIR